MTDGNSPSRLGSNEVRKAVLTTRRGGYDQTEVDAFLEEVADELDRPVERRTLTAQSVADQVFGSVALRQGYTEQEVDALLDSVVERLRSDELAAAAQAAARREPGPAAPPAPAGSPAGAPEAVGPAALPSFGPGDAAGETEEADVSDDVEEPDGEDRPDRAERATGAAPAGGTTSQPTSWLRRVTGQLRHRGR
ncbi:DivIVA domain-containing protein [Segeticoccus rhizosphaerae]|jgi:DivIVA domain-containing protein|uniref:DivIVA domain-containing protein n=2 Tax=Segeticoccus rhizosphaerae TaxID=1104777 RepID=UPI0010C05D20|nr:DivIVA domain-containing protein [Ornithinicoccus soli]